MPSDEEGALNKIKFYEIGGIPNVIGVVDGTHILIKSPPKETQSLFICRKGGHSMNIQIVCDAFYRIIDIVAKFPGSTHDSFIWYSCGLRKKFVREHINGWLLGNIIYFQ